MASVLDTSLIGYFSPVITFFFIFAIVYALLQKSKILKGSSNVHALIAFTVGLMFLFTPSATALVNVFTPWFVVLFIVVILVMVIFLSIGYTEESFVNFMGEGVIRWTILLIVILILVISMTQVFPSVSTVAAGEGTSVDVGEGSGSASVGEEIRRSIFNPRMLGALFLLIISAFAIKAISESVVPKS